VKADERVPNGAPAERRAPAGWGKPIETAIQSCAAVTLSRTKPSGHDFWTMTRLDFIYRHYTLMHLDFGGTKPNQK
jgi:hypothetical protein